jgi:hypothetical protein
MIVYKQSLVAPRSPDLRTLGVLLPALLAACGAPGAAPRAAVPAVDPVSAEVTAIEADLPGADLTSVRGPAASVVLGAAIENGQLVGGSTPECALRRLPSGALTAASARCHGLLGAYAALERARAFLLAAGAEALPAAAVLADPSGNANLAAGLRYLPQLDAYALLPGPAGARVPAALNAGAVAREAARRQLRALFEGHQEEAEGIALFLGAAAAQDPGYLAASVPGGDPLGDTDLARPLPASARHSAHLAGALWAWAEQTGDPASAAKVVLAAARALQQRPGDGGAGPSALLSLVAGQLNGAERDQACAVFRARLGAQEVPSACP